MGRPSKLSQDQWAEILQRYAKGERIADLAEEFKVSVSTVSARVIGKARNVKAIAQQVVAADAAVAELPISEQLSVKRLADQLRSISSHLTSAADYGSKTSHRLASIAHDTARQIDKTAEPAANGKALEAVVALTGAANKAAELGMGLISARKTIQLADDEPAAAREIPADPTEAAREYARLVEGKP